MAFATDPSEGLTAYGWPRYNPLETTLILLGDRANRVGMSLASPSLNDASCSNLTQLNELNVQFNALLNAVPTSR